MSSQPLPQGFPRERAEALDPACGIELPGPARHAAPRPRDSVLDGLRGLLVLIMCIDHYGGALMRVTYQMFGFVSAAEGFFFLSGYLGGLVYTRHVGRPRHALLRKAGARAARIWVYHVVAVLLLLLIASANASYAQYFARHWSDPEHLGRTALWTLLLLEQPQLLDILPMYFLLVLTMPLVLGLLARGKTWLVLAGSVLLWATLQIPWLEPWMHPWTWPEGTLLTSFDYRAWQLLYVAGLWLGWRRAQGLAFPASKALLVACAVVAAGCLVLRHAAGWDLLWHLQPWVDLPHLGPLRLVNFACLAVLVWLLARRWPWFFTRPWLCRVGKKALQIFVLHGVVLYLLLPLLWRIKVMEALVESTAAVAFAALMVVCAWVLDGPAPRPALTRAGPP